MRKLRGETHFEVLRRSLRSNGFWWTSFAVLRTVSILAVKFADTKMGNLEAKYDLPSDNSVARNYRKWNSYNWSYLGEEWSKSKEWKQSLVDEVMLKTIAPQKNVLEIGPGAGRWSEALQAISQRLMLVDVSEKCIELCKQRFSDCSNIDYFVNDGVRLDGVADEQVDYIWSFDVFVHISPADIEKYLVEFKRVLKNGGVCVIHHAKGGGLYGGWRSRMTDKLFADLLRQHGFSLIRQFDSWGEESEFNVFGLGDVITIFRK
ncbi:class I SAM-dependent methyltransferase [Oligoflexia bacterium]|nr:class I SAM-dependent methyltransferase [Oligoflexia bacterium]